MPRRVEMVVVPVPLLCNSIVASRLLDIILEYYSYKMNIKIGWYVMFERSYENNNIAQRLFGHPDLLIFWNFHADFLISVN